MSVTLKPVELGDGLIMYCAQSEDGQGDFTALAIKDEHIEFMFDTGSGRFSSSMANTLLPFQVVLYIQNFP